jgi:hypothetical protein
MLSEPAKMRILRTEEKTGFIFIGRPGFGAWRGEVRP